MRCATNSWAFDPSGRWQLNCGLSDEPPSESGDVAVHGLLCPDDHIDLSFEDGCVSLTNAAGSRRTYSLSDDSPGGCSRARWNGRTLLVKARSTQHCVIIQTFAIDPRTHCLVQSVVAVVGGRGSRFRYVYDREYGD